jgi:asparagine synthase (glutamine-hydrolysing)
MCGIFGAFLKRPLNAEDIGRGKAGTAGLAHRGPDGQGEWMKEADGVFFGHRRLSIIDLSERGAQPMTWAEHAMTYNGEIYNFRDLRQALKARGHVFTGDSDTEVLLRHLAVDKQAALDSVDGMFALAYWDGHDGWLAVDPFGEKPLYYFEHDDGVWFSSELPALLRALPAQADIDTKAQAEYLALGYIAAPNTAFRNVRVMEPGTILRISGGRVSERRRYWVPPSESQHPHSAAPLSESDLDKIRDALTASLESRLVSDVPICLFLSSGTDSALIAALLRTELGRDVTSITVGFHNGPHDEAALAGDIARHIGLDHRQIYSDENPDKASPHDMLALFGQPNDNAAVFSVRQLSATARKAGFKVGITGTGGDELFFGYQKQEFLYRMRHLLSLPAAVRRTLGDVAAALPGTASKAATYRNLIAVADHETYLAIKNVPLIDELRSLPGFKAWSSDIFGKVRPAWREAVRFDLTQTLPNSQLRAWDHGSMHASVELRTPFLSRQLVTQMASYNPKSIAGFGRKSVLRRLLERYLPSHLVERRKRGLVYSPPPAASFETARWNAVQDLPAAFTDKCYRHRMEWDWKSLAMRVAVLNEFNNSVR